MEELTCEQMLERAFGKRAPPTPELVADSLDNLRGGEMLWWDGIVTENCDDNAVLTDQQEEPQWVEVTRINDNYECKYDCRYASGTYYLHHSHLSRTAPDGEQKSQSDEPQVGETWWSSDCEMWVELIPITKFNTEPYESEHHFHTREELTRNKSDDM